MQIVSANTSSKNWPEENTAEPLKGYENRVQLINISVSAKGEKQADTIQLSKFVTCIQDVPSLHKLYPNVKMIKTKCPKLEI